MKSLDPFGSRLSHRRLDPLFLLVQISPSHDETGAVSNATRFDSVNLHLEADSDVWTSGGPYIHAVDAVGTNPTAGFESLSFHC